MLLACLRRDQPFDAQYAAAALNATTPSAVVAAAAFHRVSGLVYNRLRKLPWVPPELIEPLRQAHDAAVQHHIQILWELARLAPILDASGARWAVIKGPAVVELSYGSPGERWYGDLDILAEPARFREVLSTLQGGGVRLLDRNWRAIRRELRGELHLELPGGSLLDLHWDLVNINRGRSRIDTPGILQRLEMVDLGGVPAPTLDPTDSLLHLAVHGALSGGDRLLWMHDIALAAERRPPSWDAFTRRATEWRVAAPVGFMLARSLQALGAPVPREIPPLLLGRRYRAMMGLADRISPWERADGRLTTPGMALSRSMGYGLLGAGAWFVRRAFRNLDPREPHASSSFAERGDERDFEAFLQAVVHAPSGR